jgi:hypothetical protein
MTPFSSGTAFGPGFQSAPGSSYQMTIVVRFDRPVDSVTVTALDPDFAGNRMIAYDAAGVEIRRVSFVGDGAPGVFTTDTRTVAGPGIRRVDLVPDPLDYVAYRNVVFNGCF